MVVGIFEVICVVFGLVVWYIWSDGCYVVVDQLFFGVYQEIGFVVFEVVIFGFLNVDYVVVVYQQNQNVFWMVFCDVFYD